MQNMLQALPFNIGLLILTPDSIRGLKQIKVLDIFTGAGSKEFHNEGLFSVEAFGKVGDERRNRLFAYIDLNVSVFHPTLYKAIIDLKELYGKIMAGTAYAVFNKETKDFEVSNMVEGQTGFEFFMSHFHELQFEERKSTSREFAIKLVNKHREQATISKLIVMPAGLRDFTIEPNGKPVEDEINTLYRKVLSHSNVIGPQGAKSDLSHVDATRYSLQIAVVEVYDYIINLLEGKSKLIQGWWTNRTIFNSTRNVITSNVPRSLELGDPITLGANHTVVGLYQSLRAIFPLAINLVREIASKVFSGPNTPARLINAKTLEAETVSILPESYDEWMTQEGLESTMARFEIEALRHEEIKIGEHYFGLVYNDGQYVKFVQGIQEIPEGFDKKYVSPITYAELFYLAIFERIKKIPGFVTRYPVIGFGGIYPSYVYLKTTTRSQVLKELDDFWQETDRIANEFPIKGQPFVNSLSPATNKLKNLGADFDGDTCSFTCVLTDESISEIEDLLNSKDFYVGVNGKITFSASNDVSDLVFAEMTS